MLSKELLNALQILYHVSIVKVRRLKSFHLDKGSLEWNFYFLRKVSPIIDNCTATFNINYTKLLIFRTSKYIIIFALLMVIGALGSLIVEVANKGDWATALQWIGACLLYTALTLELSICV